MGTTPRYHIPYPEGTDPPAGHTQMRDLAMKVDEVINGVSAVAGGWESRIRGLETRTDGLSVTVTTHVNDASIHGVHSPTAGAGGGGGGTVDLSAVTKRLDSLESSKPWVITSDVLVYPAVEKVSGKWEVKISKDDVTRFDIKKLPARMVGNFSPYNTAPPIKYISMVWTSDLNPDSLQVSFTYRETQKWTKATDKELEDFFDGKKNGKYYWTVRFVGIVMKKSEAMEAGIMVNDTHTGPSMTDPQLIQIVQNQSAPFSSTATYMQETIDVGGHIIDAVLDFEDGNYFNYDAVHPDAPVIP